MDKPIAPDLSLELADSKDLSGDILGRMTGRLGGRDLPYIFA
jgi:hypothetical protein